MPFRVVTDRVSAPRRILFWLSLALLWPPAMGRGDEPLAEAPDVPAASTPAVTKPTVAKPAAQLAGTLEHVRAEALRKNKQDLMNRIDTAKDVVYTTDESPIPEDQQFQFVGPALRTPEKGDARLCLPVEVPKFYRLMMTVQNRPPERDALVGIGVILDGRQFLIESGRRTFTFGQFLDQQVVGNFPNRPNSGRPSARATSYAVHLLVGDDGFVYTYPGWSAEWAGASRLLSLDPKWAVPAKVKLFLTFPDGQLDIGTINLTPLTREEWLKQVKMAKPGGRIARRESVADEPRFSSTVDPLPEMRSLESTFETLCRAADFDELERWADRFRRGEVVAPFRFASATFYDWVSNGYVPGMTFDEAQVADSYWQQQLAFADAWIKQKPDSAAARIVKGKTLINYAWAARGIGFANTVTPDGSRLFQERMSKAEEVLEEAAARPVADSCAYSNLLTVGMALGWEPEAMERTLESGMKISTKNYDLYANRAFAMLPRWYGGDMGKFAEEMLDRVKGDDGLEIYFRTALSLHLWGENNLAGELSLETLRCAVPVMLKRYPNSRQIKSFAAWLYCRMEDREAARPLFEEVAVHPDEAVWGSSRTAFDMRHHWCDSSIPEPSQVLAVEGEEVAHLQAYSADLVSVQFLADNQTLVTSNPRMGSPFKFWNCQEEKFTAEFAQARSDWRLHHFRRTSDGGLFSIVQEGDKLISVRTPGPGYQQSWWFWEIRGLEVIRVSDDLQSGVNIAGDLITVIHARQKERKTFQVPKLAEVSLSRDGKYLLTSADKLKLWDALTGEEVAQLDVAAKFFTFLEDHSGFIYVTSDKLAVWDLIKNQERFSASFAEPNQVWMAASTKDGRYLATGESHVDPDGTKHEVVVLRGLEKPEPIHVFDGHKQAVYRVTFSPDGKLLASGSSDGIVKVWNVEKVVTPAAPAPDKPANKTDEPPAASAGRAPSK